MKTADEYLIPAHTYTCRWCDYTTINGDEWMNHCMENHPEEFEEYLKSFFNKVNRAGVAGVAE